MAPKVKKMSKKAVMESLQFSGRLKVTMSKSVDITKIPPYWSNWSKGVCRVSDAGAHKCWTDPSRSDTINLKTTSAKSCKAAGGFFERAKKREMPAGRVELDFLSAAQAKRLGLQPGPVVRLCSNATKPGHLVQVDSPTTAKERSTAFQSCIKEEIPRVSAACAVKVAGKNAPLGRMEVTTSAAATRGTFAGLLSGGRR